MHTGHRKRMKIKLTEGAPFLPHEVLELLLSYALPRKNTNELAHRLLLHFGSLDGVFGAEPEELLEIEGVGEHTVSLLKLMPRVLAAMGAPAEPVVMDNRETLMEYGQRLFQGMTGEGVYAVILDGHCGFVDCIRLAEMPRPWAKVKLEALIGSFALKKGAEVVLFHNHPDGVPELSAADRILTAKMGELFRLMGLALTRHFVLVDRRYVGEIIVEGVSEQGYRCVIRELKDEPKADVRTATVQNIPPST